VQQCEYVIPPIVWMSHVLLPEFVAITGMHVGLLEITRSPH
jgi:hypothetical protein